MANRYTDRPGPRPRMKCPWCGKDSAIDPNRTLACHNVPGGKLCPSWRKPIPDTYPDAMEP